MKNITYLEKLEGYLKKNNIVVSSSPPVPEYEKNELNEEILFNFNIPLSQKSDSYEFTPTSQGEWQTILNSLPPVLLSDDFNPKDFSEEQLRDYQRLLYQALGVNGEVRLTHEFGLLQSNQSKINND